MSVEYASGRTLGRVTSRPDYYVSNPSAWTRNSNWIAMPNITDTDEKIAILTAVFNNDANKVSFVCQGAYTVDWGDGTTENFSSNAQATHTYNYTDADLNNSHPDYKQALIVITPQSGQNLTAVNFYQRPAGLTANGYSQNWLDVVMSVPNATSLTWGSTFSTSASTRFLLLEHINIIKVGNSNRINSNNLFAYMTNLRRLDLGAGISFMAFTSMFANCRNLTEFPEIVLDSGGVSMLGAFADCRSMVSMPKITNLQYVTNWQSTFSSCYNLVYTYPITETNTSLTNYTSMFQSCYSLLRAPFIQLNTNAGSSLNLSGMFNNCSSLIDVPLYDTQRATNMSTMFQNCNSLRSIPKFNTSNVTNISGLVSTCPNFVDMPLLNISNATDTSSMFFSCNSLETIPALDFSNSTTVANLFQNCYSLREVPELNISKVTTTSNMFRSCYSLRSVAGLTTSSTLLTNTSSMFNLCHRLTQIPLFNTNAVTTATSMFQNCAIQELPAFNFGSVTNASSMFYQCELLTRVPALNLSATTNVQTLFNSCYALSEIPAITFNSSQTATTYFSTTAFSTMTNLKKFSATGMNATFSLASLQLGPEALNEVYTNLSSTGTGKTITVSGNWGTASDDPTIATAKGWTVTG